MNFAVQVVTEKWNPISASIRYLTRSWASHVEFVRPDTGDTFGARFFGGVKWRQARASRHYTYVERFSHPYVDQALEWAVTQEGKPYDTLAILGILDDLPLDDRKAWFCSPLVGLAFVNTPAPLFSLETKKVRIFPGHIPMSVALKRIT